MMRVAFLIGVAVVLPWPSFAADVAASGTIESVTVFPQGAAIARRVAVALPAGDSTVVLSDLPAETEIDSLTVSGAADQPIAIGSVETRAVPAGEENDPARKVLLDRIEGLEDRIAAIGDAVAALEGRRDFIGRLAASLPDGFSKALAVRGAGVESWAAASQAIGDDLARVADGIRALKLEERGLAADLDKARAALDDLPPPADHIEARIALAAGAAASGVLTVGYRVPSARWVPAYDASLDTGGDGGAPKLVLVRRAEVTQASGEDWTNVALTLSTARPAGGTAAPEPQPFLVGLAPDYESGYGDALSAPAAAPPPMPESVARAEAADKPVTMVEAAADFGDFRAEYRVPGAVSVDSGVGARALRIASESVAVALEVRAAPAIDPTAFLHGRFKVAAGAPLLAGRVALFRDGTYVGNGAVAFSNPGREVVLGFGIDDRVRVTRTALDRETGSSGILSSRTVDTRRFRITVENLHRQPMTVTVTDVVPYAEDERIKVERLDEATPPTAADVDDRRGVVAWTWLYGAGESRDILNAYRVSWPADESVVLPD